MPAKAKCAAVVKAPGVKKTGDKATPQNKQAQCFRNLMKYRASDLCKKAWAVLGVHGIKLHMARPG